MSSVDDQAMSYLNLIVPILITLLIGYVVCAGLLTAVLASDKGRDPTVWFVVGAIFGPMALLILIGLSGRRWSISPMTQSKRPSHSAVSRRSPEARIQEFYGC